MLSGRSTVVGAKEKVFCNLAEEVVVLDPRTGVFYSLNSVAARIWNLIQEPKTVLDVRNAIVDEYDVDLDRCEDDLLVLLRDLAAKELITLKDEAPSLDCSLGDVADSARCSPSPERRSLGNRG
jgi:hypothetical protein